MLPVPAPSFWLGPAKLSAVLPKYRELVRTRKNSNTAGSGATEDTSSLFQHAKERVLLRLQERRAAARVDPHRAFSRLRDRLSDARHSLRDLKNEQKERLKQYVTAAVGGTLATGGVSGSTSGDPPSSSNTSTLASATPQPLQNPAALVSATQELDAAAMQVAVGTNGPLRHLVLAGIGGACKLFLAAGARTVVSGQEHMAAAMARAPGRGLITVSNHVGAIDDPLITASILPASQLLHPPSVRWTLCATDRCFKHKALVPFFRAGKVLPVERGKGLNQFGMQLAQSRLLAGEWVHIFPEGTRSKDGRMLPVRKGVGWLVASAAAAGREPPLVLPFVHAGMERILPKGSALPKLGQELRVLVGEPVAVDDLLHSAAQQGWSDQELQIAIANRVGQSLYRLKAQLDHLPVEEVAPRPAEAAITISEDTLLPLIEDEMDSLAHRWHDRWQRLSLPSLTQRAREAAAARRAALRRDGVFGASGSFEEISAATEDAAGLLSSWEHDAGGAVAPWSASLSANLAGTADGAAASPATAAQFRLLVQDKLRLLRGGVQAATGSLSDRLRAQLSAADVASPHTTAQDSAVAMPMDAVSASLTDSSVASSSGRLQTLLSAAAEYSAERMLHMKELLSTNSASSKAALA